MPSLVLIFETQRAVIDFHLAQKAIKTTTLLIILSSTFNLRPTIVRYHHEHGKKKTLSIECRSNCYHMFTNCSNWNLPRQKTKPNFHTKIVNKGDINRIFQSLHMELIGISLSIFEFFYLGTFRLLSDPIQYLQSFSQINVQICNLTRSRLDLDL